METHNYWEENGHGVKYDNYNSNDGFGRPGGEQFHYAAASEDEGEYPAGALLKKGKVSRQDPMSHRIIEKRRRDRMNNCLADLSRLIPPEYLKKGRGRVEKTEIIEMAIRHLKFLQDRVSGEKQEEPYRVGYQEAVGEAVRFLVEVQGFGPGDGICVQMAAHLQRHCEIVTKANGSGPREKSRLHFGSSSETASSSSSSHGYVMKGVIQRPQPPVFAAEPYQLEPAPDGNYNMECDRVSVQQMLLPADELPSDEPLPLPLDGRRTREATLRKVRKPDHSDDFLHSYKFKNCIERRFSRSQDSEVAENTTRTAKVFTKRRRANKPVPPSASASTSCSTEDARDTSPQDTSSESTHHHQYEKPLIPAQQFVPVFALNSLGKYYVPLSVERACLLRLGGAWDAHAPAAPLHPVTIHVNFTPCHDYHVKREPDCQRERAWRPG